MEGFPVSLYTGLMIIACLMLVISGVVPWHSPYSLGASNRLQPLHLGMTAYTSLHPVALGKVATWLSDIRWHPLGWLKIPGSLTYSEIQTFVTGCPQGNRTWEANSITRFRSHPPGRHSIKLSHELSDSIPDPLGSVGCTGNSAQERHDLEMPS